MKEFENERVHIQINDDIVKVFYKTEHEIDLEHAKIDVKARLELQNGKDCYVISDVTNIKTSTKEAREYLSDKEGGLKGIKAGAFVSKTMFSYVILNLFLKIASPGIPAKFFFKTEDAEAWIKKLKSKNQ